MAINSTHNVIKTSAITTNGNHKSLVEMQKEHQKEASIFVQEELARLTGESITSDAIKNVADKTNDSTDLKEMLGIYLNQTGKASSAKYTDANGKTQSVSTDDLTLDEMKAIAGGVSNPLKSRNQGEKTASSKDKEVKNNSEAKYNSSNLKVVENRDNSQEFLSTVKDITKEKVTVNAKLSLTSQYAMLRDEGVSKTNGNKLVRESEKYDVTLGKQTKETKQTQNEMDVFCNNKKMKNQSLHAKNTSLNMKNSTKKLSNGSSFLTATSKTQSNSKNISKTAQNTINPINTKNNNFLAITAPAKTAANTSSSIQTNKVTSSATNVSISNSSGEKINKNAEKMNVAKVNLEQNESTLQDTMTKASNAKNYASASTTLADNAEKTATSYNERAKTQSDNSQVNSQNAQNYNDNAAKLTQNANTCDNEASNLSDKSEEAQNVSKNLAEQAKTQSDASVQIKKNANFELANASISEVLAKSDLTCANNAISQTTHDYHYSDRSNHKGDNYQTAARSCLSAGHWELAAIFFYHSDRLHDKADDIRHSTDRKLATAKKLQADAQSKINDINSQKQKAQEDIRNAENLANGSKSATEESKTKKEESKELRSESVKKTAEKASSQKMAENFTNVAKSYEEKSQEENSISILNTALASEQTTKSQDYSQKAASQKETGLSLESTANKETAQQNEMVIKLNNSINSNNIAAKKTNNNSKSKDKDDNKVELFHKHDGAKETQTNAKNQQDIDSTKSVNSMTTAMDTDFNGNDGLFGDTTNKKVQKPKMIFGATETKKENENQEEKTEENQKIEETENNSENTNENNQAEQQAEASVKTIATADNTEKFLKQ